MTAKKVQEPMAVLSDEMLVKPYLYRFKSVTPNAVKPPSKRNMHIHIPLTLCTRKNSCQAISNSHPICQPYPAQPHRVGCGHWSCVGIPESRPDGLERYCEGIRAAALLDHGPCREA